MHGGKMMALAIVGVVALTGCGDSEDDAALSASYRQEALGTDAPEPEPEPEESEADASAKLACGHWRNVAADASKGLLTDAELREKVKEVYDDAWVSEEPGIASGAEALLRAVTMNDGDALVAAMGEFTTACIESGALA